MGKNMVHKLKKKDRDRHFPESNGGKGSHARKSTTETKEAFSKGYDAINWNKK
jgi:hypothetical protein